MASHYDEKLSKIEKLVYLKLDNDNWKQNNNENYQLPLITDQQAYNLRLNLMVDISNSDINEL